MNPSELERQELESQAAMLEGAMREIVNAPTEQVAYALDMHSRIVFAEQMIVDMLQAELSRRQRVASGEQEEPRREPMPPADYSFDEERG